MDNNIIVEIRPNDTGTAFKASAEVTLMTAFGEISLSRLRVIHQDGKEPWVSYPEISFIPKNSDITCYMKIILPSKRLDQEIKKAVLDKYYQLKTEADQF